MPLRYYQREAVDAVFDYWSATPGHPLVDMATGTGKSLTMATLTQEIITGYPDLRVMNCTHVVELVEGNYRELVSIWPFAPAGIYAAALNRRESRAQILFAQLQTVWNKAAEIGHVDVLLIDEVHLVPKDGNTMYRKLIDALMAINPDMKIVGLSATVYRLDSGRLDEGDDKLFDKVVYEYGIRRGIDDGYLCPITSKPTDTKYDLSGIGKSMGEYKKGEYTKRVDTTDLNTRVVDEVIEAEGHRRKALFFCAGIEHATHMRDAVRAAGRSCEVVSGKTPAGERRRLIGAFKRGDIWGLTNDNVMSTGTNVPGIDLIVDTYKTLSASRYVQRVGRGTRTVYPPGFNAEAVDADARRAAIAVSIKPNCRYMDFAGNIDEHGPVDMIEPKRPGKGDGEAPIKVCPQCHEILHASLRVCWSCGYEFEFDEQPKIAAKPSTAAIISTEIEPTWLNVTSRRFDFHDKVGGTPSVRVTFGCGLRQHKTWVCPQHQGFAKSKADRWWADHDGLRPFPRSVEEFLRRKGELLETAEISVKPSGRYYEVAAYRVGDKRQMPAMPSAIAAAIAAASPREEFADDDIPF